MIDVSQPYSPGWWLQRLLSELRSKASRYELLDRYYRGDAPLPPGPDQHKDVYRWLQSKARSNWANLIVEAARERMQINGFRVGGDDADERAWEMWQANNLDADSALVHRAKMSMGDAYVIVGDVDPDTGFPLITPEDPRQVVTAKEPANRRRVRAALKTFLDDDVERAYLYLRRPGGLAVLHRAYRDRSSVERVSRPHMHYDNNFTGERSVPLDEWSSWEWDGEPDLLRTVGVPVVHFPNRADLYGRSMCEFEDVTDEIDRINIMLLQRLMVAINQAFRQRAVKGNLPDADENGNKIDYSKEFEFGFATLWSLPDGVDIWESAGVDLTPILESVKADVRDLAAVTRTPMFYLFPDAAQGSAEGASLQREGLIFKARDRIVEASDPWEQVVQLGFETLGESVERHKIEAIWQPPERASLAEMHDANIKAKAGDVPWRTRMSSILQYSAAEIDRMEQERVREFATDPMAVIMDEIQRGQVPAEASEPDPLRSTEAAAQVTNRGVDN